MTLNTVCKAISIHKKIPVMALTRMETSHFKDTESEKSIPSKAVQFNSKFVIAGDEVLQSPLKKRRYMRRGSKSASMLKSAAFSIQQQYDMTERVIMDIRRESATNKHLTPAPASLEKTSLSSSLKFYSTTSLLDEMAFLEKILASIEKIRARW